MDILAKLLALSRHGRPSLSQMKDGTWYCRVEMAVTVVGADFTVSSDFKQTTPDAAAAQCLERVEGMLYAHAKPGTSIGYLDAP